MSTAPITLAPRLERYFADYSAYHLNPKNKLTHYLGIPILTVAIPALLAQVVLYQWNDWARLDLGIILWAFVSIWYLVLDWRLGLPFSLLCLGLYFLCRDVPQLYLWLAFILGWVLQFVGHAVYEKKSPAFLKNFEHLFIGPLWVFAKCFGFTR
jgi:uncharacterized membrane protein YGL010W